MHGSSVARLLGCKKCLALTGPEISNTTVIGQRNIVNPKADAFSRDGCEQAYNSEQREKHIAMPSLSSKALLRRWKMDSRLEMLKSRQKEGRLIC